MCWRRLGRVRRGGVLVHPRPDFVRFLRHRDDGLTHTTRLHRSVTIWTRRPHTSSLNQNSSLCARVSSPLFPTASPNRHTAIDSPGAAKRSEPHKKRYRLRLSSTSHCAPGKVISEAKVFDALSCCFFVTFAFISPRTRSDPRVEIAPSKTDVTFSSFFTSLEFFFSRQIMRRSRS